MSAALVGLVLLALAGLVLKFMDFRIGPPPPATPKPRIIDSASGHDITDAPAEMHLMIGIANYSDEGLGKIFINDTWGGRYATTRQQQRTHLLRDAPSYLASRTESISGISH
ncbi:hypothetical protein K1516_17230 [Stenotrophomonas maltophilia]|uniref:hypothetical protein n=1 Tax=Stenotrophomonas maltophilia TaxID=40324 RepID=UPI00200CC334|nr:hypothetical protein [Stenotrophomonas maltophilia]UQA72830.1 hypothetical protein K1516_17230 [Stenotrophomonas maltophilia]